MTELRDIIAANPSIKGIILDEITRVRAAKDVNAFCEYAMRDGDGTRWIQQPFHREWHNLIDNHNRVLIGAPRESAKSTQISIARVLWELGNNPNIRIKIVCANDALANAMIHEISTNIEKNKYLHEVFPNLKPDYAASWSRTMLFVKRDIIAKDPSVEASGVLSTGVGGRADLLIFDDVVDFRNAISQSALREGVKKAFFEVWCNLLGPKGRAIYVGTVWHSQDLTCDLKEHEEWSVWWRPAYDAETGILLWGDKWTREALDARLKEIGGRAFSRQFLLVPISDEERLFTDEILKRCEDVNYTYSEIELPVGSPYYIGVDLASSLGEKAAYCVFFVIGLDINKRIYPIEIIRKRCKFPETVQTIEDLWIKYKPMMIQVENNSYQEVVIQQLHDRYPEIPVVGHHTGKNKADPKVGLPGMCVTMENGNWCIPTGNPHPFDCECGFCAWRRELREYPSGAYTDTIMAQWFAQRATIQKVEDEFVFGVV